MSQYQILLSINPVYCSCRSTCGASESDDLGEISKLCYLLHELDFASCHIYCPPETLLVSKTLIRIEHHPIPCSDGKSALTYKQIHYHGLSFCLHSCRPTIQSRVSQKHIENTFSSAVYIPNLASSPFSHSPQGWKEQIGSPPPSKRNP